MPLGYPVSHDLNSPNRPVRTRMPGGVAGVQPLMAAPYADVRRATKAPESMRVPVRPARAWTWVSYERAVARD